MSRGLRDPRRRAAAIAALMLISVVITAPLRGAVIFTDIPDVNLMAGGFGGEVFHNVDLNGDGLSELRMQGSGGDFSAFTYTTTRVAGIANIPPDSSGFAHPFILGSIIGVEAPASRSWFSGYGNLLGCREIGCIGLWTLGGTNYVGVEFQLDTGTHYGWLAIEMQAIFGGGHLLNYAYESEPNTPIVAGAIPEPSSLIFVGVATASLLSRRQRK